VPDVHHIPILHDVVFAFQTQRAFGAGVGFGSGFQQRVPADGFGADEVVFNIGPDGSCTPLASSEPSRLEFSAQMFRHLLDALQLLNCVFGQNAVVHGIDVRLQRLRKVQEFLCLVLQLDRV
jgi:hypothetical protein